MATAGAGASVARGVYTVARTVARSSDISDGDADLVTTDGIVERSAATEGTTDMACTIGDSSKQRAGVAADSAVDSAVVEVRRGVDTAGV